MKQLETFYWIERLGSFSAAAKRVFATQSTVSTRMQELEQSLGVELFDRSHRNARLTAKGRELAPYVQQIIEVSSEIQQRITPSGSLSGVVRLGAVEIVAFTWLPSFIEALRERYPSVGLELEIALSYDLQAKLDDGALDVVLAVGGSPGPRYVAEPLGESQFEWMASPRLQIPRRKVHPRDLQPFPFITLNRHSYHHAIVDGWMKANQVRSRRVIECNSMTVAASLATAGLGVSLMPPTCYPREIETGELQVVKTTVSMPPVRIFGMYAIDEYQPLAPLITRLAADVSRDFAAAVQG
jgi:DNA-binding transcriptional LysR family regulator